MSNRNLVVNLQLVQKSIQLLGQKVLSMFTLNDEKEKKWALQLFKCFKMI